MFRFGVVCEGGTDFHAISNFLEAAFVESGHRVAFVDLQPTLDKTQADAGWGNVQRWLDRHGIDDRARRYFYGGIFDGDLDAKACDAIIIHIDGDLIDDRGFVDFNKSKYEIDVTKAEGIEARAMEVERILRVWSDHENMVLSDKIRHIYMPAIDSTENWCVAIFDNKCKDPSALSGPELCEQFMRVLHSSEGRGVPDSKVINKDIARRKEFCVKHAKGVGRLVLKCRDFKTAFYDSLGSFMLTENHDA